MEQDFKDKVVIVTGGTRGIGAGLSKAFLERGAIVYATYAGNDEKALLRSGVLKPEVARPWYIWATSTGVRDRLPSKTEG